MLENVLPDSINVFRKEPSTLTTFSALLNRQINRLLDSDETELVRMLILDHPSALGMYLTEMKLVNEVLPNLKLSFNKAHKCTEYIACFFNNSEFAKISRKLTNLFTTILLIKRRVIMLVIFA